MSRRRSSENGAFRAAPRGHPIKKHGRAPDSVCALSGARSAPDALSDSILPRNSFCGFLFELLITPEKKVLDKDGAVSL